MGKRNYVRPVAAAELFTPNEYVASCKGPGYTEWTATCNSSTCLIFFDDGNWVSDACRGGCGKSHTFTAEGEGIPEPNCWLLINVRSKQGKGLLPANTNEHLDLFSSYGNEDGVGWTLKDADSLKGSELVRGYYKVLENESDGHTTPWLVTSEPDEMKQMS